MAFNLSSSSLHISSLLASSFASLDEESMSSIDVPSFLQTKRRHHSRKVKDDLGKTKTRPHSTDATASSSSSTYMLSLSAVDFEPEEQEPEQAKEESNIPEDTPSLPKAYFIPGITGRARCLEGSTSNIDVVTRTPPRRRVNPNRQRASRSPRPTRIGSMATGSTCSGSSSGSMLSADLSHDTNYDSISERLAEARELLDRHYQSSGSEHDVCEIGKIMANLDVASRLLRSAQESVSSVDL
jgi:hypothetical protein